MQMAAINSEELGGCEGRGLKRGSCGVNVGWIEAESGWSRV
jgi:hypothetical protein